MLGEACHCRAERSWCSFDASLTAAGCEPSFLIEAEGKAAFDQELLQGPGQGASRAAGHPGALQECLGVLAAGVGNHPADGADHETGAGYAVAFHGELGELDEPFRRFG
jgi:hypothetical protein